MAKSGSKRIRVHLPNGKMKTMIEGGSIYHGLLAGGYRLLPGPDGIYRTELHGSLLDAAQQEAKEDRKVQRVAEALYDKGLPPAEAESKAQEIVDKNPPQEETKAQDQAERKVEKRLKKETRQALHAIFDEDSARKVVQAFGKNRAAIQQYLDRIDLIAVKKAEAQISRDNRLVKMLAKEGALAKDDSRELLEHIKTDLQQQLEVMRDDFARRVRGLQRRQTIVEGDASDDGSEATVPLIKEMSDAGTQASNADRREGRVSQLSSSVDDLQSQIRAMQIGDLEADEGETADQLEEQRRELRKEERILKGQRTRLEKALSPDREELIRGETSRHGPLVTEALPLQTPSATASEGDSSSLADQILGL